jgi:chromate transport protein ChrA
LGLPSARDHKLRRANRASWLFPRRIRKWLNEAAYTDIIALCQFLPGPASSQVGIILGMLRAGLPGGFAAWLGFTMPSALALIAFAYGIGSLGDISHVAWLHGLKIVAVAVVPQAVWRMAQSLRTDRERVTLAVAATLLTLAIPSATGQIGAIVAGGIIGFARRPMRCLVAIKRDGARPPALALERPPEKRFEPRHRAWRGVGNRQSFPLCRPRGKDKSSGL